MALTAPNASGLPGDAGVFGRMATFYAQPGGATAMGECEVLDGLALMSSAGFGEASASLDGQEPEAVALRLLLEAARAALARCRERPMRDDEANARIA